MFMLESSRETRMRSKILFSILILAVGVLWLARGIAAQDIVPTETARTVILTDAQTSYVLDSYLELLADDSNQLSFQEVVAGEQANQFVVNHDGIPGLGINGGVRWIRLRVRNESTRNDWLVGIFDPRVPFVDFYAPAPDGTKARVIRTGAHLPFALREIQDANSIFHLPLAPGQAKSFYFRVASPTIADLPVQIWSPEAWAAHRNTELLWYGLFYGAMLIMAGYNFFLFFSLRERVYFYLALVIFGFAFTKAAHDGLGHQFLWGQFSNHWTIEYSIPLTMFAASLFTSTFLELPTRAPKVNFAFNVWRVALLVCLLLVFFVNSLPLSIALLGAEVALIIIAIGNALRASYRPARLFLMSWILPLGATLVYVLYSFGVLPFAIFSSNLVLASLAALALLWSLVLADRIQSMRAETLAANRSLARSERQYRSLFQDSHDAVFIITTTGNILDLNPAGLNLLGYTRAELETLRAPDLFESSSDYQRLTETLERENFVADYETKMRGRDAQGLTVIVTGTRWRDEERGLAGYQGILRDVTERRRTQAELATYRLHLEELVAARTTQANAELAERRRAEAALEQRVQELSALNEIAKTISTVTDLTPALELVAKHVTQLFNIASTVIAEIDGTARTARLLAQYPHPPDWAPPLGATFSFETVPLLEQIANANQPLEIRDAQNNPQFGLARDLIQQFRLTQFLLVPLRVGGSTNGVMALISARAEPFVTDQVLNLAETIGGALATAIENARLYQQAQATAVADERQRLARELHDSVTQLLYSIVLLAGGWSLDAEQNEVERKNVAQSFNELAELGQQALGEMRLLLYQLQSPVLTEIGLSGALQQRLNAVEHRVGIQTQMNVSGDVDALPVPMQKEIYLIAQEALNNALRHARATRVQIQLARQNQHLELAVHDNGTGFQLDTISEGMGLRNMRTRAHALGGQLELLSTPGTGTRVQLFVALENFIQGEA